MVLDIVVSDICRIALMGQLIFRKLPKADVEINYVVWGLSSTVRLFRAYRIRFVMQ